MDSTTLPPAPKLTAVEQVSDGWINKYLLTFRLSDGSDYTYEAASRRSLADFRRRMENLRKIYELCGYRYAPYFFDHAEVKK